MKIFKKVALIVVASSVAFSDPITGAFGIKFGQDVNTLKSDPTCNIANVRTKYFKCVVPPVKNELFKSVMVEYTPKTHKVYRVDGFTISKSGCMSEYKVLSTVIENKYKKQGDPVPPVLRMLMGAAAPTEGRMINIDKILLSYSFSIRENDCKLEISYIHPDLQDQADAEIKQTANEGMYRGL